MPPLRPFSFSERTGRYRRADGRFVSTAEVRTALDRSLNAAEREVRSLSEQLRDGRINLIEWELRMRAQIKAVNLYSHAAATGGWAQLSPAQLGKVGAEVREQYRFLRQFARDIETGKQPLDGRFLNRAGLYAKNGRKLYHQSLSDQLQIRGYDQERNVRFRGDSCAGCVAAEAAGWVSIKTLQPIGTRECRSNCRCRMAYRNSATGEEFDSTRNNRKVA